MAAFTRFGVCCGLARHITPPLRCSLAKDTLDGAMAISGVRYYRGSHRDTKRRERNRLVKIRKRQGIKPRVFDKWQFIRENYDKELYAFKHRLQLQFHDDNNLLTALTHESYKASETSNESPQACEHNAKFALLGFTLTSQYITEYLCRTYPVLPVTGIRHLHDFLVSRENISKVSELISLPELIRLEHDLDSVNNEKHLSYRSEDIVCDAFFALVGAISVDQGSEEAQSFVHDFVATQLQGKELHNLIKFENPQTVLENMLLAQGQEKPMARVIQESGKKTHLPAILVGVFSGDKMIADAGSHSAARATKEAMNAAVLKLVQEKTRSEPFLSTSVARTSHEDHQGTHELRCKQ